MKIPNLLTLTRATRQERVRSATGGFHPPSTADPPRQRRAWGRRFAQFLLAITSVLLGVQAAAAQFADVTAAAGLKNENTLCFSAAWGDYNNDGYIDLHIASGGPNPHLNALYQNNRDGTFARMTGSQAGPIATDSHASFGNSWIDFNNDGYLDLLVINGGWAIGRNDLYYNNGDGTFARSSAGNLTSLASVHSWFACADYDGDGWVDVFAPEAPSTSSPFHLRLYHASPSGTFSAVDFGPTASYINDGVWGDYDNDGDPDLFVCYFADPGNPATPSRLWRNDGRGRLTPMTNEFTATAAITHAAWADYDNDGDMDIALTSFVGTELYRNDGAAGFVSVTNITSARSILAWSDYDNDGFLDFVASGGEGESRWNIWLFHNNGDGTFSAVSDVFTVPDEMQGLPWGDYDNDGFMDLVLTHGQGRNKLYHNLGNANHWIKFRLVGTAANAAAIGAKVRVLATINGKTLWQLQEVNGGYMLQNDLRPHFGLGDATNIDLVRIEWPSGNVTELTNVAADRILKITEAVGIVPARPTSSLNGSMTLVRSGTAQSYQWRFGGVDLPDQTDRSLVLTDLTAERVGRYSVVADTGTEFRTNHVFLTLDPTFTKITTGPLVEEQIEPSAYAWGDYDGDGWVDLFVANFSGVWDTRNALYHNLGKGAFERITAWPFGEDAEYSSGATWGDFDNDGQLDLFVGNRRYFIEDTRGTNALYRSLGGGAFTRSLQSDAMMTPPWAGSPTWVDYDKDGYLDLFFLSSWTTSNGKTFNSTNSLFHNNGDGSFTPVDNAITQGISDGETAAWADYDNDGRLDLLISAHARLLLYHQEPDGSFVRVTKGPPVNKGLNSSGIAWGDYDNDGRLDLFVGDYEEPPTSLLFHNLGDGAFERVVLGRVGVTLGGLWGDYDNDGLLDLYVIKGYDSKNILYRNLGGGRFSPVEVGSLIEDGGFSGICAWADYDNNGFLDLVMQSTSGEGSSLYHNNGNGNRWLLVKLIGTTSNRSAIGARVYAEAYIDGKVTTQMRELFQAGNGDPRAHFGLGGAKTLATLRIEWPSGTVQELPYVASNQILTITEPRRTELDILWLDGVYTIVVTTEKEREYALESSPDLVNWAPVLTFTGIGTPMTFQRPEALQVQRFYRVTSQ